MPRLAIMLMFTALVLITGSLLSIPFVVRDPLPVVRPPGSASFEQRTGELSTKLELQVETGGRFELLLSFGPQQNVDIPTLALRMVDHEMAPLEPAVQAVSNHAYRAMGWLPMAGQWQVSLRHGDTLQSFQFILQQ